MKDSLIAGEKISITLTDSNGNIKEQKTVTQSNKKKDMLQEILNKLKNIKED